MAEFSDIVRRAMTEQGLSLRALARTVNYDPGYISRVVSGKQSPSGDLVRALDTALDTDGALVAAAEGDQAGAVPTPPGGTDEATHLRTTVSHLVSLDGRFGGDEIAPVAVRVWKAAQRKLDQGIVPPRQSRDVVAATAEAAELAGWLLFDADDQPGCRNATLEAQLLARQVGDRSMERFALTNLAMHDIETGRPGEAIRIAESLLDQPRLPQRVGLLAKIRRGRALAQLGHREPAIEDLTTAQGMVQDSITATDPPWTWWVNECEVAGHFGEALLDLGQPETALPYLEHAQELAEAHRPDGRGSLYYRVSLVTAYARVQAWSDLETTLHTIPQLMDSVSSKRNHRRLHTAAHAISQTPHTPEQLKDLAHTIAAH
ncbi:helix-turn-helix transcriptional regulator [Spiractinospora alimapuensis]|uniref:helix-turn-helix domain-containing protein n=1 Tax=Spiractinospora alimapuensis TaxID=2820884 RepID=UPI001F215142|nr:helix-turn-helix domain-containing protein [Spiractinospora alimapuensis]QVQ54436.1 helix-turn-helix transcriptional regulator [Spiractinospora alimapuensis]